MPNINYDETIEQLDKFEKCLIIVQDVFRNCSTEYDRNIDIQYCKELTEKMKKICDDDN